jgi:hypothetical protein
MNFKNSIYFFNFVAFVSIIKILFSVEMGARGGAVG